MKKKLFSILLVVCMIATMLVGCGSDGGDSDKSDKKTQSSENLNTEKQISAKNFTKTIEAFKEFYDEFYEEHRFNGSYQESEDCLANIYMIGGTPVMVILDMLVPSEDYFTADLYVFEYVDKEVQERAKYSSLNFGDDEIYLYPLQDKLFMVYFDEEREQRVAELNEYFTELDETYYVVPDKDFEADFEEDVQSNIQWGIRCDDYEEFVEEAIGDNSAEKIVYYETGVGDDGLGGSYLLVDRGFQAYCLNTVFNYALVVDWGLTDKDGDDGFIMYDTSFKKYLDYLMEQEITNNIQLLLAHADYLDSIGVYDDYWSDGADGQHVDTVVWFDGIYYYVVDDTAYVLGYDFGYSEDDLPKSVCGLEVEASVIDLLLDYAGDNGEAISDTEEFPISYAKRESVEKMWEQVTVAKEEYEQTVGVALEAYEDYLDDNEDYIEREMYRYRLVCVDDNDIPELILVNDFGHSIIYTYYNGSLISQDIDSNLYVINKRLGLILWTSSEIYKNSICRLKDGEFEVFYEEFDSNNNYATINFYSKNGEGRFVTKEEYDNLTSEINENLSVSPPSDHKSISYSEAYDDFDDACEEAGLVH